MNGSFKVHPFFASLLLTASSGTLAQQVGVPGGGSASFFDTRNVGSLLGHSEAGTFGALGNGNQWVGIGQPTIAPGSAAKVPANGLRSQWAGQSGIFALKGTGTVKDLAIQWGPNTASKLSFIFLEDLNNPSSTREVMTVLPNGKVGIGKTNPEFTLDVAGTARVTSVAFDNSLDNTAVGNDALRSNTSGFRNTAVGVSVLRSNTSGRLNTASGGYALFRNTTGSFNTASGGFALYRNTTGNYNIALGYQSGYRNSSGSRNVFLGYKAGYNETGSDKLYIANASTSTPLIYGDFAADKLDVNGSLRVNGIFTTAGTDILTYPAADGNSGEVLVTDGNGNLSFAPVASSDRRNTRIGHAALRSNTTGNYNTASGVNVLRSNTSGNNNTSSGANALRSNIDGSNNTASGVNALRFNRSGVNNTASGVNALRSNTTGNFNIASGVNALRSNTSGSYNTALGYQSGYRNISGSRNVFLGYRAGYNESGSDKLYIGNSRTSTPLIYGDFAAGKLGINTNQFPDTANTADGPVNISSYSLFVKGGILSESVIIETGWADYVFDDGYTLMPLKQVEAFIAANGHLPNVPSAAKVERQGIEVGNMTRIQQEKIEELTLYIIAQQKKIEAQHGQLATQRSQLTAQEQKVAAQQQQLDALNQKVNALLNKP